MHELEKIPKTPRLEVPVVSRSVGAIGEADVKLAGGGEHPGLVVGFNVKVEPAAAQLAERLGVTIATFDIIYRLAEWLGEELEKRRPRSRLEDVTSTAKILKVFSATKHKIVLGGKVETGLLAQNAEVKIMRRDLELGRGTIESLQSKKIPAKTVEAGSEFGAMVKTDVAVAAGDKIEAFEVVYK